MYNVSPRTSMVKMRFGNVMLRRRSWDPAMTILYACGRVLSYVSFAWSLSNIPFKVRLPT